MNTQDFITTANRLAAAVDWHRHFLAIGQPAEAAVELENARKLAAQLLGEPEPRCQGCASQGAVIAHYDNCRSRA